MLAAAIFFVISEVYILIFKTKHIDYSKGVARILFLGKYPENHLANFSLRKGGVRGFRYDFF